MYRLIWRLIWMPAFALAACGAEDYQRPRTVEYITQAILAPNCGNVQCHSALSHEANYKFDTLKDERQCRNRLGLGTQTFDSMTMMAKPLSPQGLADLILVIKQFQDICKLDKGMMVGGEATQWARDATNKMEITDAVKRQTGETLEILTPAQEGQYGYVAAAYGRAGKISLDPGSNSFQVSWQETGSMTVQTVSVPFGYVRGAAKYYPATTMDTYDAARAKHAAELQTLLNTALGNLMPPANLMSLKALVTSMKVGKQVFVVGQDAAIKLSLSAALRNAMGMWIDTQAAYDARANMEMAVAMPMLTPGFVSGLLGPADLTKWFADIVKAADFMTLRTTPVRPIYGEKALANAVLLDVLITELGLDQVILVPQEMPMGFIIAKVMK